jgi:hypothetical protein
MAGSLSSLSRENFVCSGNLASCWCSSAGGVLVLDGEVEKGSTLAGVLTIEMSIFDCYISSSCSPTHK